MDGRLRRAARPVYTAYAWVFVVSGAAGVLGSQLEPSLLHGLTVLPSQQDAMASLLNQLRFLRGIELGFGLAMLWGRQAFFATGAQRSDLNRAVLAGLLAAPLARSVSLVLDGPPVGPLTGLLVLEWALFLWLRRASEPLPGGGIGQAPAPGIDG
jgi:hypothetical protein